MKVLIVGGGGREHAIAWKISQSPKVEKLYCAPGNAGIAKVAECVDIGVMDFEKLVAFAGEQAIDLVVVGPDDPLAAGAVDAFEDAGIRVFGPGKNAAILEASKAFSKDLMKKYNIPSAAYETFDSPEEALAYLETAPMPIVLKADGLALGKGVLICNTREEAKEGVKTLMLDKQFGSAGDRIVIEEFMTGREALLCGWPHYQNHDLGPGPQESQGRGSGTEYRGDGNIFTQPILYGRGGCILQKVCVPANRGRHEGRGQGVQRNYLLWPDADGKRPQGAGVQCQVWRSGDPGSAAQDEE